MISVREARNEDIERIAEIGISCFPDDFITSNNANDWFSERNSSRIFGRYHVAEISGKVVGYIFHLMIGGLSGVVQLEQIGVDPEYRKKGIGTELIMGSEIFWKEYLQEKFDKSLYKMLLTTSVINDKAHNLYVKCGFKHSTTMEKIYWGNDEEIWIKEY
jgi:GNAT superfamily N-acetyltransferase